MEKEARERESKYVVIMETKRIMLGIHNTQAKPKKTFAITKNGQCRCLAATSANC
jgi:hypothetical protein